MVWGIFFSSSDVFRLSVDQVLLWNDEFYTSSAQNKILFSGIHIHKGFTKVTGFATVIN